jgi:hypothetical protein
MLSTLDLLRPNKKTTRRRTPITIIIVVWIVAWLCPPFRAPVGVATIRNTQSATTCSGAPAMAKNSHGRSFIGGGSLLENERDLVDDTNNITPVLLDYGPSIIAIL